jgi:hypothetical protein
VARSQTPVIVSIALAKAIGGLDTAGTHLTPPWEPVCTRLLCALDVVAPRDLHQ